MVRRIGKDEFVRRILADQKKYKKEQLRKERRKEKDYVRCIMASRERLRHYKGAAFKSHR